MATYTAKKLLELGAKVVTMSDSDGTIYVPEGLSQEQLDFIFELKTSTADAYASLLRNTAANILRADAHGA